jgi:hypothetical protein
MSKVQGPTSSTAASKQQPEAKSGAEPGTNASAWGQANELQFSGGPGQNQGGSLEIAARGVEGSGSALPHLDKIQASFGRHDVSQVQAYTGGAAAAASAELGAQAYATGDKVAFSGTPDLFTAAHEAAHVVQQQGGVQLKGGVGQAGDRHEQHADAVAGAVVRGESAEGLLDQYATGASATGSAAVQRDDNGTDPWRDKINRNMRDVKTLHDSAFDFQALAVRKLKTTAGKDDPPSLVETVLMGAVEFALIAATGGIGGAVAIGVTKKLTKFAIDPQGAADAIKVIGDMAKDTAKAATKKITGKAGAWITSAASQYPEGDQERAAKICFDAQEKGLIQAKTDAGLEYNAKWEQAIAMGEEGYKVSQALLESMQEQYTQAEAIQRDKSVQQWAVYQAQTVRGATNSGGTNMGKGPGPFVSDRGTLSLTVDWYEGKSPVIRSASMPGMNAALRPDIAAKTLAELNVPIKVRINCGPELGWFDKNLGKKVQPSTTISRDEKGGMWCNKGHTTAMYWLARQTGTRTQEYAGRRWYTTAADPFATTGAVFQEMSSLKPPLN